MANVEITPLMLACQKADHELVRSLLVNETKLSIEAIDSTHRTALFYCTEHKDTKCIDLLFRKGHANLNHQDKDGYSCLHLTVINGNKLIVEYLIKNGANVNITDSEMHSVVHWCVVCGQDSLLDYLLANNADPETADIHGAYPIHYAAQMCGEIDIWDEAITRNSSKSLVILKKLLNHKVKIDVEDNDQRNAIIWAASSGSSEAIMELYKAGADPNKHEKDGLTALHCASSRDHSDCIKILIEKCKCSVDIMDNNNCTPIFYAATLGKEDACKTLIKYGANLHVQDCKGRTVYHCAASKGQLGCLKILCQHDSSIWFRNRRGDYAIHEAYYNKETECVYYLLDKIDDKRAINSFNLYDGRTLLHLAASENDLKLCKKLVNDGLDINCLMKTSINSYMTPYDVAVLKNAHDCAKYLKSKGGLQANDLVDKNEKFKNDVKVKHKKKEKEKQKRQAETNDSNNNNNNNASNTPPDLQHRSKSNEALTKNKKTTKQHDMEVVDEDEENHVDKQIQTKGNAQTETSKSKEHRSESKFKLMKKSSSEESISSKHQDDTDYYSSKKDLIKKLKKIRASNNPTVTTMSTNPQKRENGRTLKRTNTNHSNSNAANVKPIYKNTKQKPEKSKQVSNSKINKPNEKQQHQTNSEELSKMITKRPIILQSVINNISKSNGKSKKESSNRSESNRHHMGKDEHGKLSRQQENSNEVEADDDDEYYEKKEKKHKNANESDREDFKKKREKHHSKKDKHHRVDYSDMDEFEDDDDEENNEHKTRKSISDEKESKRNKSTKTRKEKEKKEKNSLNSKTNDQMSDDESEQGNENIVRLIFKSETNDSPNMWKKKYGNMFERQRLILKSLYEIRRLRINNKDIIIHPDLNSLLLKYYNFDIQKNCKSLRDLEKTLETFAVEISDDSKRQNKRLTVSTSQNKTRPEPYRNQHVLWKSSENLDRSDNAKYNQTAKSNEETPRVAANETENSRSRNRQERHQLQNTQLKIAYKPLLPNDIYKQYYTTKTKVQNGNSLKEVSPREKTVLLPVISQKPGLI